MSGKRGKREAAGGNGKRSGNPFAGEGSLKMKRWMKIVLIVLCSILALALAAVAAWKLLVRPPDVSQTEKPSTSPEAGDTAKPGQNQGQEPEGTVVSQRKEDYFTFLLLGKDTSSGSTDTMILVSYDVPNGAVNCVSIPRDTMVNVSWDIKRINSVYSSRQGLEGLKEHISCLTGIMPDCHIIIEWEAVGELVDALDGVYFEVPYNMDYDDDYQDLHIHQEKGYRLLDGDDAMQVIRWRANNDDSPYGYRKNDGGIGDTGRMKVQQDFLKAVAKQCLQLGNWTKISDFARIFAENIETDLSLQNILWFAEKAMSLNMDNVNFMTLPVNSQGWAYSRTTGVNQAYAFPYPDQIVEMMNQYFNPYMEEITEEDLQIMGKNKDGSLYVTNGTLADPEAGKAPVKKPSSSSSSSGSASSGDTEEQTEEPAAPPETGEESGGEANAPGEGAGGETAAPSEDAGGEANTPGENTGGEQTPEGEGSGEAFGESGGEPTEEFTGEPQLPPEEPGLPPEEPEPSAGEAAETGGEAGGETSGETGGETGGEDPAEPEPGDDSAPPGWL